MQGSFWWWQCSDRYNLPLPPPPYPFSPSLIGLMVSADVKHHVYLLCFEVSVCGSTLQLHAGQLESLCYKMGCGDIFFFFFWSAIYSSIFQEYVANTAFCEIDANKRPSLSKCLFIFFFVPFLLNTFQFSPLFFFLLFFFFCFFLLLLLLLLLLFLLVLFSFSVGQYSLASIAIMTPQRHTSAVNILISKYCSYNPTMTYICC